MSTLIVLVIKVILFLAALKKLWDYVMKSSLVNILLFIIEAHKASKKIENDNKRTMDTIQKSDTSDVGRVSND